jgi:hypothetical protein
MMAACYLPQAWMNDLVDSKTNVDELLQNISLNEQPAEVSHGNNASQRISRCQ